VAASGEHQRDWFAIRDERVLQRLHRAGRGVIGNPSDRNLHHAACDDIEKMRIGTKKYFFPTFAAAESFIAGRQAEWGGGTWTNCQNCSPRAARPPDPARLAALLGEAELGACSAHDGSAAVTDSPADDIIEASGPSSGFRAVEAWSDVYLPFEPKTFAAQELRRELRDRLRRLAAGRNEVLHAVFAGERPQRADVENLLLYNVDMDGGSFASVARDGLRFELATRGVRPAPSGRGRAYAYQYRAVPRSGRLVHWHEVRQLARWEDVQIMGPPRLALVWLALRRGIERGDVEVADEPIGPGAPFAVRLDVRRPTGLTGRTNAAPLVKPAIDGVVSALQVQRSIDSSADVAARLAAQLAAAITDDVPTPDVVASLLTDSNGAVLGVVERLVVPRADGVQWAPADDLCLAGEVLLDGESADEWQLSGRVAEIASR
jgi:hypothetical protein